MISKFIFVDDESEKTERIIALLNSKKYSHATSISDSLAVRLIISHIGWRSNWDVDKIDSGCRNLIESLIDNKVSYELKGGVSNGPDFQRAADKYFDFTCYISDCETIIENSRSEEECFNKFLELSKKKSIERLKSQLLHLFLPLDIDMQALEILNKKKKNGEKAKRSEEYLAEMYEDKIKYSQKLLDLQEKAKELPQEIDKDHFNKLCGITNENVYKFFEMLDRKETDHNKLLKHKWGINGVTSFHDWFCKLAECLRSKQ